jgi:2-dehydro-3-deoxy-D-arabinonate dehydratase
METRGWRIVRFAGADGRPRLGALDPAAPTAVRHLAEIEPVVAILNGLPCGDVVVEALDPETLELPAPWRLLAPTVAPETWCAGVTYERSRDARLVEAQTEARDVYALVYDAERPELFMKDAAGRRTVGPGGSIGVRSDQAWTVPEPELALLVSGTGTLLGATIGNDVSSRDIEGANPLYIPQAKIFGGCAAIGPAILVPDDWSAPFPIELTIRDEGGAVVFAGETSTARLKRSLSELTTWLSRENPIAAGTILMTGTGLVPPDEFALRPGHVVEIRIEGIGLLRNGVGPANEARP